MNFYCSFIIETPQTIQPKFNKQETSGRKPVSVVAPSNSFGYNASNTNLTPAVANEPKNATVSRWLQTVPVDTRRIPITNPQVAESSEDQQKLYDNLRPLIKEANISGHMLHIFSLMKKPYLISTEVSMLFPKWKKKDLLSKMIKLKKQNIPTLVISRLAEDHEWFLEQCVIEEVQGIETSDGELVETVTMYPLESIGKILSLFGAGGGLSESVIVDLSNAIGKEQVDFNPHDKYWSCIA